MKKIIIIPFLIIACLAQAQEPHQASSAEIFQSIKKLDVLGNVLYLAAHPDDENTRFIAYCANEKLFNTGYLSLTRGDGGQNLIGTGIREELGIIRTQELLAARRTDGGQQFFTRANDFGYSKTADETLEIWDKEKVLSDVVWVIRKFKPDVIVCRFPPDGRGGHGHHTSSALLGMEAFEMAADKTKFQSNCSL
jgi:LmbE family N-acetylglucosaminyl deacetylase